MFIKLEFGFERKSRVVEVYFRAPAAEDSLRVRVYTSAANEQALSIETDFGPITVCRTMEIPSSKSAEAVF